MAKKIIVVDEQDKNLVTERIYRKLKVFEIPLNKGISFHLKVLKAKNVKETKENVYWIAQSHDRFKTRKFNYFKGVSKDQKELHVLLNELNKGTKYEKRYILNKDGNEVLNPNFHVYTPKDTGFVKSAYVATNPYKSHTEKREGVFLGNLKYIQKTLGKGIWLEGINYTPEFKEQGAFILAVDKPQVLSLLVERRTLPEKVVRSNPVKKDNCDSVEQELLYGDVLDIHMHLHNVLSEDYKLTKEVFYKGESMTKGYSTLIDINIPKDEHNPSLDYNVSILDEHVVNLSWAGKTNHKEAKDSEDSLQEYTMVFIFTPVSKHAITNNYPTIKREVTLTVNYKSDFSATVNEKDYVTNPNIVKVWQPPLITQLYEQECNYTELTVSCDGFEPKTFLKESEDGALLTDDRGTTPIYSLVLGNKNNIREVTIQTDANVANCPEINEEDKHAENVFNLKEIQEYTFADDDGIWNALTDIKSLPRVQPYHKTIEKTDQTLKFKAAYPYDASSESKFLWRYLFMHMIQYTNPAEFYISVNSCRYKRTIWFNVHPDVIWAEHLALDVEKKDILYHDNIELPLVKGDATYISVLASALEKTLNFIKPLFDVLSINNNSKTAITELEKVLRDFIKESKTDMYLGFHARYDIPDGENQVGSLINYAEIQPYKAHLHFQIINVVLLTLAVDVLMIYLTRGKLAPGLQQLKKAQKVAKRIDKGKDKVNKFLDKYNLTLTTPKITMNAALRKEMQPKGAYATIFDLTFKADPLLALNTEYKIDSDSLKGPLKEFVKSMEEKTNGKFELIAKAEGRIVSDINISYNTHTNKLTLNKNAIKQENEYNKVLRKGDIIKTDGRLRLKIYARGNANYRKKFEETWFFKSVEVEVDLKGELKVDSSIGIIQKIGYTKGRGPYIEKVLYFGGLQGTYMQSLEVKLGREKGFDSNEGDQPVPFTLLGPSNASLGKDYIFELFESKKQFEYENK
ncbi:hypothetical protein [Tenacibaculum sp. Ill]|uniref:hypothetical protein n=1 Tax=Tenacibaculum sp. Ill TaxID=3445935 RepID=UPI003F7A2DD5